MRLRDLGITIGTGTPGELNAITDVSGVRVGHVTLVEGSGRLVVGSGPVRTGVTVVLPHGGSLWGEPLFAGAHRLNGNGELTGLEWIRESGLLTTPIGLTNTHSVGVVRDALVRADLRGRAGELSWRLPVVGETWDGILNDINGFHVTADHVDAALAAASSGPVAEGAVGAGTGMICHGFKGGIGTASRVLPAEHGGYMVGVLVQANHGRRERLVIDGEPVGRRLPAGVVPLPLPPEREVPPPGGSIIVVVATDAPLLPHQCRRVAQRAGLGIARTGGAGEHTSGDLLLCCSTAHRGLLPSESEPEAPLTTQVEVLVGDHITALFDATIEATEEAIANCLVAADTMTGRDDITAHGLDGNLLASTMTRDQRQSPR